MANRISDSPATVPSRRGTVGNVRLAVDVHPDVRAALVRKAREEGRTMVSILREAVTRDVREYL